MLLKIMKKMKSAKIAKSDSLTRTLEVYSNEWGHAILPGHRVSCVREGAFFPNCRFWGSTVQTILSGHRRCVLLHCAIPPVHRHSIIPGAAIPADYRDYGFRGHAISTDYGESMTMTGFSKTMRLERVMLKRDLIKKHRYWNGRAAVDTLLYRNSFTGNCFPERFSTPCFNTTTSKRRKHSFSNEFCKNTIGTALLYIPGHQLPCI